MLLVEGANYFQTAEQLRAEEELKSTFLVDEVAHPATGNVVERVADNIVEENTDNNVEKTAEVYVVR